MRDSRVSSEYWDEWIAFSMSRIERVRKVRETEVSRNPAYEPQYIYDLALRHLRLTLQRYSRGDRIDSLTQYFAGLLDAWEEAERLGKDVWTEREQRARHSWEVNLDHYIDCFWLVGLALTLDIPDEQWRRLLDLVGNEGEDELLDRVIASRQPDRRIGAELCFPGVYDSLLGAVNTPVGQQAEQLREFVDHWYPRLKGAGHASLPSTYRTPYWYSYGDHNLGGGAYFGRWCIEAVAVAKAFAIDDRLCLDHPYYPGDLLQDGRSPRYSPPPAPVAESKGIPDLNWSDRLKWKLFAKWFQWRAWCERSRRR